MLVMDLPFALFIPFGKGGVEQARRVPPASLQLPSRTAETYYELIVSVQQGRTDQRQYAFPVPISRYDTLSTFGMYNRPESAEQTADHLVTLAISLPRWSYGPLDPVSVYIKLSPNPDWMSKAKKVKIEKITVGIEEEITYNPEGDEPTKKVNRLVKHTQQVGVKMPEAGYFTNLGLVFPFKDTRDADGIIRRGKPGFPMYSVTSFTTTCTLYKIEFFLVVKVGFTSQWEGFGRVLLTIQAHMSSARDIVLRQPIVVCPLDQQACKETMEAIEQAAKDASLVNADDPMLPASTIIKANDRDALRAIGMTMVGSQRKILID